MISEHNYGYIGDLYLIDVGTYGYIWIYTYINQ